MKLTRILLPIDFSEKSAAAAAFAKSLASLFQAELTVAHVFELSPSLATVTEAGIPAGWYEERKQYSQRALDEFCAEHFRDLPVQREMLEGDVAHALVEFAHEKKMDLIVMPTHGYGAFRRFILGSVTAKVLHDADCPVLTGVHIADAPVPAAVQFRNVLCAVDFDTAGEKALRWASGLAQTFGAKLSLVHALPPPMHVQEMEFYDPSLPAMLRQVAGEQAEKLQARVGTSAGVILEQGSVAAVVRDAAMTHHADLVVIGRHEDPGILGRLRANAYSIVRESPCPVVSV